MLAATPAAAATAGSAVLGTCSAVSPARIAAAVAATGAAGAAIAAALRSHCCGCCSSACCRDCCWRRSALRTGISAKLEPGTGPVNTW